MTKPIINDGGFAFPIVSFTQPNGDFAWGSDGMSLRDYFAAQSIAATADLPRNETELDIITSRAYRIADAMLKARGRA